MSEQNHSLKIHPIGPERLRLSLPEQPEGRIDARQTPGMVPISRYGDDRTPPREAPFEKYQDHVSARVTALINCWLLRGVIHNGEAMYLEERVVTHEKLQKYWLPEETGSRKEWYGEPGFVPCVWGRDAADKTIGIGQVALADIPEAFGRGYALYVEKANSYDAYTAWQPLHAPLGNEVMLYNPAADYVQSTVEDIQEMAAQTGATRAYVV